MEINFTRQELEIIKQSLIYTKKAFEETLINQTGGYPTLEFKKARITGVQDLLSKLRNTSK